MLFTPALDPTGFNPGFGQSPYGGGITSPPPAPAPAPVPNTSPANVFAQMKSGTFANENAPQSAGSLSVPHAYAYSFNFSNQLFTR